MDDRLRVDPPPSASEDDDTASPPSRRRSAAEGLVSGLVLQGLLLVSGIVAARMLGPTDRGYLSLIWIVAMASSYLGTGGLPLAVTYELASGRVSRESMRSILSHVVLAQLIVMTLVVATLFLGLVRFAGLPPGPAALGVVALSGLTLQTYGASVLQGSGAFRSLHVHRLLPSALYTTLLIFGAALGSGSLLFATAGWVASLWLSAILTLRATRRLPPQPEPRDGWQTPNAGRMVRFGSAGLLGYASPTETFRVDQLVVGLVLSVRELGLYGAALAFCNLPRFLAQGLGLVAYPAVAAAPDQRTQRRLLWKFASIGTVAAMCVTAPIALFAEPLIRLTFGEPFTDAAATLQIAVLGTVVLCLRRLLSDGLRGAGHPGSGSVAEALSWAWLLPALAVFVPWLGLEGVAAALATSYVVTTLFLVAAIERRGLGVRSPS